MLFFSFHRRNWGSEKHHWFAIVSQTGAGEDRFVPGDCMTLEPVCAPTPRPTPFPLATSDPEPVESRGQGERQGLKAGLWQHDVNWEGDLMTFRPCPWPSPPLDRWGHAAHAAERAATSVNLGALTPLGFSPCAAVINSVSTCSPSEGSCALISLFVKWW